MKVLSRSFLAAVVALAVGCNAAAGIPDEEGDGGTGKSDDPDWTPSGQQDGGGWTPSGQQDGGGGGGGGTICGDEPGFGDATFDACINSYCCPSFLACVADAACAACLENPSGAGCTTNALATAFDTCIANSCDGGGGGGGGGTGICGSGESSGDATVDACLSASCCAQFDACDANAACVACFENWTAACDSNPTATALDDCWGSCDSGGGGGGTVECGDGYCDSPETAASCPADCDGGGGGGGTGICGSGASTGDATLDACLSASCCPEFLACDVNAACVACFENWTAACDSNAAATALDDCWYYSCG